MGLVLEPGYVMAIADGLLCWVTFSCRDDATRRAEKHQEKKMVHAVSPRVHKESKFRIPAPQRISDKYHPQRRQRPASAMVEQDGLVYTGPLTESLLSRRR